MPLQPRYESDYKVRFAGHQLPRVSTSGEHTGSAQVGLYLGPLILWLQSKPAVDELYRVWHSVPTNFLPNAVGLPNPVGSDISQVIGAVAISDQEPLYRMRPVVRQGAGLGFLRLQVDSRVTIDVLDRPAYFTLARGVAEAAQRASGIFLGTVQLPPPRIGPRPSRNRSSTPPAPTRGLA